MKAVRLWSALALCAGVVFTACVSAPVATIVGVNLGSLPSYLLVVTNGSTDAIGTAP
jgi:hypothetical protein